MTEETNKPNEFGKALQEWWDSDAHKQLQEASEASIQKALGKYHMLSEDDKYNMVQAILYIICETESKGTSHRGLQDALGLYPQAFWISELLTVHNSLWSYYHDKKQKEELEKDIKTTKEFLDK